MPLHILNPSTQDAEAFASLRVQDQPGLHKELQAIQGYTVRLYFKSGKGPGEVSQQLRTLIILAEG